jgi:glycine/sarcosine N-methyltransferase
MSNDSLRFYDAFASKYDVMLSSERYLRIIPFFKKIFEENEVKSILDCACGTGRHAIAFSQLGFHVEGCDLSSEMLECAKINAITSEVKVNFVQADFKKLPDAFNRKFDCIVCVGNSLTHELEEQGVSSALESMNHVLGEKGLVIIQIRNTPKLIRNKTRIFPIHHHKEPNGDLKLFFYVLDFYPSKVTFNVVSYIENDSLPKFEVNSVDYNPISESKLASLMLKAGFKNLKTYGNFEFAQFRDLESENIVIVGNK